jgi:hypothetical protein
VKTIATKHNSLETSNTIADSVPGQKKAMLLKQEEISKRQELQRLDRLNRTLAHKNTISEYYTIMKYGSREERAEALVELKRAMDIARNHQLQEDTEPSTTDDIVYEESTLV